MRLTRIALIALSIVIAALIIAELSLNPWRKSDAIIRARLFAITPVGSNFDDVRQILIRYGWHDPGYQTTLPSPAEKPFLGGRVGGYQSLPWHTTVCAFWEFDKDERLVDIQIQRIIDSP